MVEALIQDVSIKVLLEAGAHFGHQTSRWHPLMKRYIFTQRNGIHIIDLEQTLSLLQKACSLIAEMVSQGEEVLFVGTKKQAQLPVMEAAARCGMPYVNQRWIGGTLTNFAAIQARLNYLVQLESRKEQGEFDLLTKKEALLLNKKIQRLNRQMAGIKEMTRLPSALFVVDLIKDHIAIAEAKRVRIPIVAIVDTNCNPTEIDYPIPANDDAIGALKLMCNTIANAVIEGKAIGEVDYGEVEGAAGLLGEEYMVLSDVSQPASVIEATLEPIAFASEDGERGDNTDASNSGNSKGAQGED